MKKKTKNTITSIIGFAILVSIIPIAFIVKTNLGVIIPAMTISGISLVFVHNVDGIAQIKNFFK